MLFRRPLAKEDKRLRKKSESVSLRELSRKSTQNLIDGMLELVYGRNHKGLKKRKPNTVGLSANQVGISKCISIVDLAIKHKGINDIHALINPKMVWHSEKMDWEREGCVNLPKIWGVVPRYKEIKVEALDRSGNKISLHLKGWPARLLQHEIDHLNGHLFIDRLLDPKTAHLVQDIELPQHKKNFRKWKKFIDVSDLARK